MVNQYSFECNLQWVNLDPANKQEQYESIKRAGAISYANTTKKSATDFVKMIVKRGHYSVLEQSNVGIEIDLKEIPNIVDSLSEIFSFKELILSKHLNIYSYEEKKIQLFGSLRDFLNSFIKFSNIVSKSYDNSIKFNEYYQFIFKRSEIYGKIMGYIYLFLNKNYSEIFNESIMGKECPFIYYNKIYVLGNNSWKKINNYEKAISFRRIWGDFRRVQFYIVCSRDISHQIVRKRSCGFNQESQRYVKYEDEYPIAICEGASNINEIKKYLMIYSQTLDRCHRDYKEALHLEFKPEIARKILNPFARTRLYLCDNLEGIKDYIKLRNNKNTQPEHKWIAEQMEKELKGII